jgi:hypothetical protein
MNYHIDEYFNNDFKNYILNLNENSINEIVNYVKEGIEKSNSLNEELKDIVGDNFSINEDYINNSILYHIYLKYIGHKFLRSGNGINYNDFINSLNNEDDKNKIKEFFLEIINLILNNEINHQN